VFIRASVHCRGRLQTAATEIHPPRMVGLKMKKVLVLCLVSAALFALSASQDDNPFPAPSEKECNKVKKDLETLDPATFEKYVEDAADVDQLERVTALQIGIFPCLGWDDECVDGISETVAAGCFPEVQAITKWVVSSGVLKQAKSGTSEDSEVANGTQTNGTEATGYVPEIKQALEPCCGGQFSDTCCNSLVDLYSNYGSLVNGSHYHPGCLCPQQTGILDILKGITGQDPTSFVETVLNVINDDLGCKDTLSRFLDDFQGDGAKIYPDC